MNVPSVAQLPGPTVAGYPQKLMRAVHVTVIAERLLQVRTGRVEASLSDLGRGSRQRYEDAAAVALALLEDEADVAALYAAAHTAIDLGAQTSAQRRELVEMTRRMVDRFHEVLAGHHAMAVERLRPMFTRDEQAAAGLDIPAGGQ